MLINSMTSVHKGQDLLELLLRSMKETALCQEEGVAERNPLSFQEKSNQVFFFFLQVESDTCDLKKFSISLHAVNSLKPTLFYQGLLIEGLLMFKCTWNSMSRVWTVSS